MDSRLLPEPDSDLGYSEGQLVGILGDRIEEFHEYMLMKTCAIAQDGSAIYYPVDVRRYVELYVPPRARRLTLQEIDAIFRARLPAADGDHKSD